MSRFDSFSALRAVVLGILVRPERYSWTLQGFGMLRTYISNELRLHVWDPTHRVPDVTDIHDHPWHFDSLVVSGKIVNTRYKVHPCTHNENMMRNLRLRQPFLKSTIVCGTNAGNHVAKVVERGERVWLEPLEPETYLVGQSYRQLCHEVHHSSPDPGTVTLVKREFQPDTEHAHVFFKADKEWVSAEPRGAYPSEVTEICERAIAGWKDA